MPALPQLKRGIRFRDLTLLYVATSFSIRWTATAASAGPSSLVVWVIALFCFFIPLAACVMELSSRHPDEGGVYIWTQRAFGDGPAYLAAWTYWTSNLFYFPSILYFGAASALFAFGASGKSLSASPTFFILFATITLALITLLNIRGINAGKWLNNVSTLGGILPIVLLVVLGAVSYTHFGSATTLTRDSFALHWSLKDAVFWSTMVFAFSGVEAGSAMGDEIENPRRTIPFAILAGGAITAIGYIAGTAALLVAVPSSTLSGPDGLLSGIQALCARTHTSWLIAVAAILVAISTVAGASAYLSSTSRLPFVAGIDHYLPPIFGSIHPRFRTPWIAIGAYGGAGIIVALLGQAGTTVRSAYEILVSMTIITTLLPFLFIFAAMIRVQREPTAPGIRRVPGGSPAAIVLACIGFCSTAATIVLSAIPSSDEPHKSIALFKVIGGTAVMIAAGLAMFLIGRYKARALAQTQSLMPDA
jgi:amino acid transporter